MVNCRRVESDGIVKSWIYFSSAFGRSLENHSCTRGEEFLVPFNGSLRARATRILVSNENSLTSGGGMMQLMTVQSQGLEEETFFSFVDLQGCSNNDIFALQSIAGLMY